jgi:glucan 1,3-beta-glucosidase
MSSQPNTPYHPVDTGEGHQDDPPVDQPGGAYTDHPFPMPPVMDRSLDPSFNAEDINRDSLVEDGIARPRFLGHAAGIGPSRGSLASSFGVPSLHDNSSSLYALNPLGANRDSAAGYASVPYQDDPHDSDFVPSAVSPGRRSRYLEEKRDTYTPPNKSKRKVIIGVIAVGVTVVAIAIVVALYFTVIKKNGNTSSGIGGSDDGNNDNNNDGNNTTPSSNLVKSGGDGSNITLEDGTKMTYSNKFGGTWYWDPDDPFNNNAQAQSWTPPLNQSFKWGQDRIFGSVTRSPLWNHVLIILSSQCQSWRLACHGTCKFFDHLRYVH